MTTARTRWAFDLPYDRPPLHENQRLNHYAKNSLVQQVKDDAHLLAQHHKLPKGLPFAVIELRWWPAGRGRRDDHNLTPTLKAAVDGLVRYGLVVDDDAMHVQSRCIIVPGVTPAGQRGRMELSVTQPARQDEPNPHAAPAHVQWAALVDMARHSPIYHTDHVFQQTLDAARVYVARLQQSRDDLRAALGALHGELWDHGDADPGHRERLRTILSEAQRVLHETEQP